MTISQIADFGAYIRPAWVQAGSTVVLVCVTFYYSRLIKTQIESERRQEHSNTLRNSVSEWLDNIHPVRKLRLLIVSQEFRIIPKELRYDPYIDDFRNNHAPEVDAQINRIDEIIDDFRSDYEQYLENTSDIDDTYFPVNVELPDEATLNELVFYLCMESDGDSIAEIKGVSPYVESYNSFGIDLRFSHGLFTESGGYTTVELVPDQGEYENFIEDFNRMAEITGDFEVATEETIENMPEKQQSLLRSCRTKLKKVERLFQELQATLEGYNTEPIYPGYCKFIDYSYFRLKLRKWVFNQKHK